MVLFSLALTNMGRVSIPAVEKGNGEKTASILKVSCINAEENVPCP
jgi:hypothetical protein